MAGLAAWVAIVTAAGLVMREAWPAYASVADAMTFTLPMMIARLTIGAIATLAMGWTTAAIARHSTIPAVLAGVLLLLAFIPVHVMIWDKFPVWYHLTFLLSLIPFTLAGAKLVRPGRKA